MYLKLDLTTVPPTVTLEDPDNFKELKVVAAQSEHVHIAPEQLRALAGERAQDPAWTEQLEGMIGYAQAKGWTREDGAVRAHVEWS